MQIRLKINELRKEVRKRQLHAHTKRYTQQTTQQPKHQSLQQIDLNNLPRPSPQRLHNRNRIQPLLQMRPHRHRNAHRAQHQRHQAHQRQQTSRPIQPLRQRRIRLAIINNLRLRQQLLQPILQVPDSLIRNRRATSRLWNLKQKSLPRMAPRSQQPTSLQPLARNQHPRPCRKVPRQTIRLIHHNRRNPKQLIPNLQLIAKIQLQPNQQIIRHSHSIRLQRIPQRRLRRQLHLAIKRIQLRINSLQRNQQRIKRLRRRSHRKQLRHRRHLNSLLLNLVQTLLLLRRRLHKHSRRKVRRHNAPSSIQQRRAKRRREPPNPSQRSHANGHRQNHKEKFALRRAHLASSNLGSGTIRKSRHNQDRALSAATPGASAGCAFISSEIISPSRSVIRLFA